MEPQQQRCRATTHSWTQAVSLRFGRPVTTHRIYDAPLGSRKDVNRRLIPQIPNSHHLFETFLTH